MKHTTYINSLLTILTTMLFLSACTTSISNAAVSEPVKTQIANVTTDTIYTLKTIAKGGKLLYEGVGGEIDGVINPDLFVQPGGVVQINLLNGDSMQHDVFFPDFNAKSKYVSKLGDQTQITFGVGDMQPGSYVYYCTVPGHRQAGQEGKLIVRESN